MRFRGPLFIVTLVVSATGLGWVFAVDNLRSRPAPYVASSTLPPPSPVANSAQAYGPLAATPAPQPPSDDALGYMLVQVATQYEQNSRYPSYSVPLSEAQASAYAGNRYHPVTLPLSNGGEFTVTLDKFRFTRGEDILVVASLSGPMVVGQRVSALLESSKDGRKVSTSNLSPAQDGLMEGVISSDVEPGEYRLIVEASVDGRPLRHVSTLTVEPNLGKFEGVGSVHVKNNDLIIPLQFDAELSGHYALSGHLFVNGRPVANLTTEQQLSTSGDEIELKAHGSVLAPLSIKGAMQLKNLQIRRLPARPGDRTDYAFGPDEGYEFSPPDLDALRDKPARDPLSEQRAALLKNLASKF